MTTQALNSLEKQTVGTQKGSVQETVAKKQIPKASVVSLTSMVK